MDDRQVVVIGSGPAGAMAAWTLVELGVPVTLLDMGAEPPPGVLVRMARRNLFRRTPPVEQASGHRISGDPETRWQFFRAPGGLSNQWTGAVPRFAPEDFTEGERLHERYRWPVTYADVEPYYTRVEKLMMVTADTREVPNLPVGHADWQQRIPDDWQKVDAVARRYGQGLTSMPLADGPPNLVLGRGTAFNSYIHLVRPLLRRTNFRRIAGAQALQLEWSPAAGRVSGVVYHDHTAGVQRRIDAAAVVVACGALHSTKLLFDSTSADFPDGLGNTHGVLGRYLHDHPREWWSVQMRQPMTLLSPPAYLTRRPHAASKPLLATSWTLGAYGVRDKVLSRFGVKGASVGVQVFGTMVPTEDRYALPAPDLKDDFGLPSLDLNIAFRDDEIDNVIRARKHLLCLIEEAGFACAPDPVAATLYPGGALHYGGTVRMHGKPEWGVLDGWNRMHAVRNVVVCDASCFTTGGEKNPTLTVMALAMRAVERLVDDLKTGDLRAA